MYSHFCLDVFGETILRLVQVPFARCTLKPAADLGTVSATKVRGGLPLGHQHRTLGYFPTRNYLTAERCSDGKWVLGGVPPQIFQFRLFDMIGPLPRKIFTTPWVRHI
ncbi:hypothetical protein TNCV_2871361 [Trichonephila clavipes]|nr:hypothetical protein TNCV_2871361 [Trichonephila clavipes]